MSLFRKSPRPRRRPVVTDSRSEPIFFVECFMPNLPPELAFIIAAFCPLFSQRVWPCGHVLLIGAILAPGRRTVASALRVMGLSDERHFQNYHRALNRAVWSCGHAGLI